MARRVRREDADEYTAYIRDTGIAEYTQTPGNRGAWMLRRNEDERFLLEQDDRVRHYEIVAGD